MASRHRVRAPCLQIIKTATVPAAQTKRVNVKQFHDSKIQFPLTRRMARWGSCLALVSKQFRLLRFAVLDGVLKSHSTLNKKASLSQAY